MPSAEELPSPSPVLSAVDTAMNGADKIFYLHGHHHLAGDLPGNHDSRWAAVGRG